MSDTRISANSTRAACLSIVMLSSVLKTFIPKTAKQQESRLRCWHTTIEQQEVKTHPVCCSVLHFTSPTATLVLVFTFRTRRIPTCLSVWLSHPGYCCACRSCSSFFEQQQQTKTIRLTPQNFHPPHQSPHHRSHRKGLVWMWQLFVPVPSLCLPCSLLGQACLHPL